jgi:hypothetical protein
MGGKSGLGRLDNRASNRDAPREPEQRLEMIPRYPDWSLEWWMGDNRQERASHIPMLRS